MLSGKNCLKLSLTYPTFWMLLLEFPKDSPPQSKANHRPPLYNHIVLSQFQMPLTKIFFLMLAYSYVKKANFKGNTSFFFPNIAIKVSKLKKIEKFSSKGI